MINSGRSIFELSEDMPYALLPHMGPGICVDVNPFVGHSTKLIAQYGKDRDIVAIEPFSGNVPHFYKETGSLRRVKLVEAAAFSSSSPRVRYEPLSVIPGKSGHWSERYSGGASMARIGDEAEGGETVKAVRLDEVVKDHVAFMKISARGAGPEILTGAQGLFDGPGVDLVYVDFRGDRRILDALVDNGFRLYEDRSLFSARDEADAAEWSVESQTSVSTGDNVVYAWPRSTPKMPEAYVETYEKRLNKLGTYLTNHFLAVHEKAALRFNTAVSRLRSGKG